MTNGVFKDSALDRQFAANGYVTLPLLSAGEVAHLKAFFLSLSETDRNVFTTFVLDSLASKQAVDRELKRALSPHFERLFQRHEPFWGNYFIKQPNGTAMPLHADLQYVEEPTDISFNIWCPLVDTALDNGALGIVPRSHLAVSQIRGTNITRAYRYHALAIQEAHGKVLSLKAGEAVIYDHRLLHYSVPNLSDSMRIAITMVGTPIGAQKLHYYAIDEDTTKVEKYHIESADDLMRAGFQQRPGHLAPMKVFDDLLIRPLVPDDFRQP